MVTAETGENEVVFFESCCYAANVEKARSGIKAPASVRAGAVEKFPTPGVVTITFNRIGYEAKKASLNVAPNQTSTQDATLPQAASSTEWYRGWRDHLEFCQIGTSTED